MKAICTVALAMVMAICIVVTITTIPPSGPNCPGMNPSWIGFCE